MDNVRLLRFQTDDVELAVLEGELDSLSANAVRADLLDCARSGGTVHLDIAGLWFCDSSGLRLLFEVSTTARECGTDLWLEKPTPTLRTLLDLVDARKVVNIST